MARIESLTAEAIIALVNAGTWPNSFPVSSGVASTLGSSVAVDVSLASNVVMHLRNTGTVTMAAGTWIFEGSLDSTTGLDGSWFPIQAVRSDTNTVSTSATGASLTAANSHLYAFEAAINGVPWFRVRCTVATTANSIATWRIGRSAYPSEPIPASQSHPVTIAQEVAVRQGTGTAHSKVSTASTNATIMRSSSASLHEISMFNPSAALAYLKLYDKASAPVPASDTPVLVIPVATLSNATTIFNTAGKMFLNGISYTITGGPASADTSNVAAGLLVSATYT